MSSIGCMPIVTGFNEKAISFSVDIYERDEEQEEKIGKASVILGQTEGEPYVKYYQVQTRSIYLSDNLARSCFNRNDKTYLCIIRACMEISEEIWG